jgi:hypothetical protein
MAEFHVMYGVVYGPEWEDVMFFADLTKARFKLLVQTLGNMRHQEPFHPILVEYSADGPGSGVFRMVNTYHIIAEDATEGALEAAKENPFTLASLVSRRL